MKKSLYYFFTILSFCVLASCGSKEERTIYLDLLICESPKDGKLTEQQVVMLTPFEKDGIRYVAEGIVFNGKTTQSYVKEKSFLDKLANVQKPLFSVQELVGSHLKGIDLSSLSLEQPLSIDDVKKSIANYDVKIAFSTKQPQYISKYFTNSKDIISYVTDSILIENPEAKIVIVVNPPITPITPIPPTEVVITLNKTTLSLKADKTAQLTATILPDNVADKTVTWKSSDEKVATVSETGLVKAEAAGNVEITAYTGNGVSASCKVEVKIGGGGSSGSSSQSSGSGSGGNRVSVSISGGTYTGETKNGQPHGMGTIRYNTRTLIDSRDTKKRYAEKGEYISGEFYNGRLVQGKLFDSANNHKETIVIGRAN
jgi:hypothetical protein